MNKKGQLMDRPFIFIFILVVSAFVFIFGFYLINNLMKASNCAQAGLFINDLKENINRYYNFDEGSGTELKLKLNKKITHICFTNKDELNKIMLDNIEKGLFNVMQNSD